VAGGIRRSRRSSSTQPTTDRYSHIIIMNYVRRATLLVVGLLSISSVLYVDNHGLKILSRLLDPQQQKQEQHQLPSTQQHSGRRLQVLDAETQQKHMRSYLGGLYPPVDSSKLPLYLRDTLAQDNSRSEDLVFFWHIPKASGSTVKNILNFCFDLSRSEQLNETASMEYVRDNILNMDTSSPDGLAFSFANQIVNSGKVDVIVSNYFLSGAALFTKAHYGKTFTILRHPGEIALSLFYYRGTATWERSYREDFKQMSFGEYVNSNQYMPNWMVRQLTATAPWVELTESHLDWAKRLLKQKVFVGQLSEIDETFRQLKAHFGWEDTAPDCIIKYLHSSPSNTNAHRDIAREGVTWKVLVGKEKWDMSLYYYGLELFAEQSLRYP